MLSSIHASAPSGNGRRIQLLGTDLIFGGIDNVFVYPSLDIARLQNALSDTLSFWPILTGRAFVDENRQHSIEFSDHSIPFTYSENDELEQWPDLPVVIDDAAVLTPFIDSIQYKPETEPLLRLKVTLLLRSGEFVLGTSFCHLVGDADSNLHFLNDLSQRYQQLEPSLPRPVFERHLLAKEDPAFIASPVLKFYHNAGERATVIARLTEEQPATDPLQLSFSSEHIARLHALAAGGCTAHDALCAYVILLLNKHALPADHERIRRAYIYVNYRGVTESLASSDYVANAIMQPLSSDFPDPLSLPSIAKTLRQLVETTRRDDFLQKWVTSANVLMTEFIKNGRVNFVWDKDEVVFNSNYKYDWASQVNFGMTNQCRFHTLGLFKFYFRIFRLNPTKDQNGQWTKDSGGAEVAFRIPKGEIKEKFLAAWKLDVAENFLHVK